MVFLNGFVVEILPTHGQDVDKFTRDGAKYVGLDHGAEYKIKLVNNTNRRADVKVELEGEVIGKWRVDAHDFVTIERPADKARKFTFLSEMSMDAIDAGVVVGDNSNGLVVATFYPEKERVYETVSHSPVVNRRLSASSQSSAPSSAPSASLRSMSPASRSYESGATVLGDRSHQQFDTVRALNPDEIDWDAVTRIQLRLVSRKPRVIRRSTPYPRGTPYPDRIDEDFGRYTRI